MNKLILIYCFFLIYLNVFGINLNPADSLSSEKKDFEKLTTQINKDSCINLVSVASAYLGTPYVASALEINETEQLVINFRGLDCMTMVENCIALTRVLKTGAIDLDHFYKELQFVRYRNGIIDGYTSRLHYTSDWIYNNEKKGILKDKSKEIGGKPFPINISFMSTHPESYKQLKLYPELIDSMKQIELEVNKRKYYYIPKNEIVDKENLINDGDIICFTTSIRGLDISHLGIACRKNGILTFIHASSAAQKVIVNPESIADYCNKIKSNTGIMVLSLLFP